MQQPFQDIAWYTQHVVCCLFEAVPICFTEVPALHGFTYFRLHQRWSGDHRWSVMGAWKPIEHASFWKWVFVVACYIRQARVGIGVSARREEDWMFFRVVEKNRVCC